LNYFLCYIVTSFRKNKIVLNIKHAILFYTESILSKLL